MEASRAEPCLVCGQTDVAVAYTGLCYRKKPTPSTTILEDAAIRGIAALVRQNGKRISASRALQKCMKPLLWATYPVRWLFWQLNLGPQIYVFARKSDSGGGQP